MANKNLSKVYDKAQIINALEEFCTDSKIKDLGKFFIIKENTNYDYHIELKYISYFKFRKRLPHKFLDILVFKDSNEQGGNMDIKFYPISGLPVCQIIFAIGFLVFLFFQDLRFFLGALVLFLIVSLSGVKQASHLNKLVQNFSDKILS